MAAEQVARVDVTDYDDATSWGLGWARGSWDGTPVLGHDGNTIGQSAFLRLLPEHGIATVLLTNGGEAGLLHRALLGELLADLVGVTVPAPVVPARPPPASPPEGMVGTWAQASARLDVRREGDGLVLRHTDTTPFAHLNPEATWERPLVPYADGVALVQQPQAHHVAAAHAGDDRRRVRTCCTSAGGPTPGCEPARRRGGSGVDVRQVAVPVADDGVARDRVDEPLQVVVAQRDRGRGDVLLEVRARAWCPGSAPRRHPAPAPTRARAGRACSPSRRRSR